MNKTIAAVLALLTALPSGAAAQAGAAQLVRIGAAAAVKGRVEALAPVSGAVGRIMQSGKEVYANDKVTTDDQGRLQVLLIDETTFTL
ncbi:MAG: hypothetical protein FD126_3743, partial [Elusimicrobia bacterium]